jgi:hypothetical protein
MQLMKSAFAAWTRKIPLFCGLLLLLEAPRMLAGEPAPANVAAFNLYAKTVENRLAQQHTSTGGFLAYAASDARSAEARLRRGEHIVEQMTPAGGPGLEGAMLHHWRGTAFAPGATAADFERMLRDFNEYPRHFAPQVVRAKVLLRDGDRMEATMEVRQRHVIPVVLNATYEIQFGRQDARHGYSLSRSTRIEEIGGAGTGAEHALSSREEHGFLWRMNTYWSYEERDGGLYLQIESISLTRDVPGGIGWMVRPYVESIPRESMEFTLRSASNAVSAKGERHE